jgi:hypothetical protein
MSFPGTYQDVVERRLYNVVFVSIAVPSSSNTEVGYLIHSCRWFFLPKVLRPEPCGRIFNEILVPGDGLRFCPWLLMFKFPYVLLTWALPSVLIKSTYSENQWVRGSFFVTKAVIYLCWWWAWDWIDGRTRGQRWVFSPFTKMFEPEVLRPENRPRVVPLYLI